MNNPFHEIERILEQESTDAVRALLATIYLECCEECGARLRTEEFSTKLQNMVEQMKLCRRLSGQNAA